MLGRGYLTWQKYSHVKYAEVVVDVELILDHGCKIDIPQDTNPSWSRGIKYGFMVFQEAAQGFPVMNDNMCVQVEKVHGHPVDTTIMCMAYATFHAIEDAMKLDVANAFTFDENTGKFSIAGSVQDVP